ncbi:hypothetical protein RRG08_016918 [Elysia crispata]|uniref:Uncharacterized protein n=1 Tax=Elysia crispata TaxID=231223 RepID=A0AAE0ZL79_9GAST|nr:hypothetical protein RRG08_016918 [Elysia crispata]
MCSATPVVTLVFLLIGLANSKWNGLRVRYCTHPEKAFFHQPRLVVEAKEQGFKPVRGLQCNASVHYRGIAYAKDGDRSLTLLYDIHGFIGGIQAGIPINEAEATLYPSQSLRPPFVLDDQHYIITMYFTNPDEICKKGRKASDFEQHGTGENLWLQTGQYPHTVAYLPRQERNIAAPWVQGKCYPKMGTHYWYNISTDMSCENFYPVFLMYNNDEMTGFGWSFVTANLTSANYEHPDRAVFPLFFHEVPECLTRETKFSAMHVYLTNNPYAHTC